MSDIQQDKKTKNSGWKKTVIDTLITVVAAAALALCINMFIFQLIEVNKTSMVPTLQDKEIVFLNKTAYWFGGPKSGDIIVFEKTFDGEKTNYVKRVIGIPGDEIKIQDGKVYRNGVLLREPYLSIPTYGDIIAVIPDGEYFVMGDNRNLSLDSKSEKFGLVKRDEILGKVIFKTRPLDTIDQYVHDYADK